MNSYADTTYADEYLSQMYGEQWTGIDMGKKQYALNHASLMIDLIPSIEGIKYKGHKTNPHQEAVFPRNITGDEGPERVKQAVCQEAMYIVSAEEDIKREQAIRSGVRSKSAGSASESYASASELSGGIFKYLKSDIAVSLIAPYITYKGAYPIR